MKLADKLQELENAISTSNLDEFMRITDELYQNTSNDKERNVITKFVEASLVGGFETMREEFDLLKSKAKMLEIDKIISYAYIAENYFHKSNEWLYQRVRGYNVNGKPAKFSKEELGTLNFALQDISKKIGSVTFA